MGSLTVQGAIDAKGLRARSIRLTAPSNSGGTARANLKALRASQLSMSGPYKEIDIEKGRIDTVDIRMSGCDKLSAQQLFSSNVKIRGEGKVVDLCGSHIKSLIEFSDLNIESIDLKGSSLNKLSGNKFISGRANLDSVQAIGKVELDKCEFSEELSARASIFDDAVSFARCSLPGVVDFSSAYFKRGASFKVGSGADIAKSPGFKQIGEANFSGTRFDPGIEEICINFDGRETLEAASFEGAIFAGVPMFYECEFHENISFRGAIFQIEKPKTSYWSAVAMLPWRRFWEESLASYRWPQTIDARRLGKAWGALRAPLASRRATENYRLSRYERAYNALRQRFSEVGNAKYERQFHNYELRARRRRIDSDAPPVESVVSWIYDVFSQYGQSISRPLVALFAVWLFCSLGYFLFAGISTVDGALESAVFSARQIVKPFSAWSRDFALAAAPLSGSGTTAVSPWIEKLMLIGTDYEVLRSTLVRVIATVQSFVAIVLLFLSGLAVRRTFGVG